MNTTSPTTIDGQTFGIGVLSVTACVLLVGLLLVSMQAPTPAYGIGTSDRGGDYIMITQQVSNTTEGVVVIDAAAKQLIVYAFDYNSKSLEILEQVSLDLLPKPREREIDPRQQPGRGRR